MSNIKKIKIFVNDSEESKKYYKKLVDRLLENGFSVDDNSFDLAIAIGGDGCFLRMVKECKFNSEIYYVGIHTGTFGFAQDINTLEIDYFIDSLKKNSINFESRNIQPQTIIYYIKDGAEIIYTIQPQTEYTATNGYIVYKGRGGPNLQYILFVKNKEKSKKFSL